MRINAYHIRASVSVWLGDRVTLDGGLSGDRVAYQDWQGQEPNEWRLYWDGERGSNFIDQAFTRIVQVERKRDDGDENALELETAAFMTAIGLDKPGARVSVPIYHYPDEPETLLGRAILSRLDDGEGWQPLPDPYEREGHIRAAMTLRVVYGTV